ncbi:MAG: Fic family protein [Bifidobacteriaceae bacterium]|jgi:Fic family protein|nr:Fic family protein [Bifidobacteriaceae bacterium]
MFSPVYSVTPKLLAQIGLIERARGRVDAARLTPEQTSALQQHADAEMIAASAGLSDDLLTRKEIDNVLLGRPVHAPGTAVTAVLNARAGIEWARERAADPTPLGLDDIREVHAVFTRGLGYDHELGDFRAGPAVILHRFLGSIWGAYKAPPAEVVPDRLEALLRWMGAAGADPHPVVAAGIAHQEIASIRPFTLATGQVARLVSRIALAQHGYGFHGALALGSFYVANRAAYHTALDNGASYLERARSSRDEWLEFYLRGLLNEVDRITAMIAALEVEGFEGGHVATLRRDEAALIAFAESYGSFTKRDAASILSPVPSRLVAKRLQAMVDDGRLVAESAGDRTRYRIPG